MKFQNFVTTLTIVALYATLTSCGDDKTKETEESPKTKEKPIVKTYQAIMQEEISAYQSLDNTLAKVNDRESARAAIPALRDIGFKFNRIKTDQQNAEAMTEDTLRKLKESFRAEHTRLTNSVGNHLKRLQATSPEAFSITSKVLKGITQ